MEPSGAGPSAEAIARASRTFDGVLCAVERGRCTYYQDRNRRWPFYTSARGHALLERLVGEAARLVAVADAQLAAAVDGERLRREGESIYARKPNKKSEDVTWSQREYAHAGLQREYVRFKSVQRFTETWAALERAHALGALGAAADAHTRGGGACRVASLGGGPGFELLALRVFFEHHFPSVRVQAVSLDLATEWRPYCAALGVGYAEWDVRDGAGLLERAGGPIDFAIVSYVLHHCARTARARFARARAARRPRVHHARPPRARVAQTWAPRNARRGWARGSTVRRHPHSSPRA